MRRWSEAAEGRRVGRGSRGKPKRGSKVTRSGARRNATAEGEIIFNAISIFL